MQSSQYGRCKKKYGCKGKKLYFAFVDLEKAFDRVPREVTRWALSLRKAGVDEWFVKAVMAMYEGAQTVVRTTEGDSKAFNVKVGLHQGSNASQSFICRCCKADSPITDGLNTDLHLDIGNGLSLEKVDKFCYLGDLF